VRIHEARRKVLDREQVSVETPYGSARVKVARRAGKVVNAAPEFDDCQRLAQEKGVPLKQVIAAAEAAYFQQCEKAPGAGGEGHDEVIEADPQTAGLQASGNEGAPADPQGQPARSSGSNPR
jgi:hypothetical protein